jgi:hypothetical protein
LSSGRVITDRASSGCCVSRLSPAPLAYSARVRVASAAFASRGTQPASFGILRHAEHVM